MGSVISEGLIRNGALTHRQAAIEWAAEAFPDRWGSRGPQFSDWRVRSELSARFQLWGGNNWYLISWEREEDGYLVSREMAGAQ